MTGRSLIPAIACGLAQFPSTAPPVPRSFFLPAAPFSPPPTSSSTTSVVSEPSIALPDCCWGISQQWLPRPRPTHSRMTTARQSLRTTPFFLRKAQVRRTLLLPLSSLPPRVHEFLPKGRMRPSLPKHDPLQPHSPPPLSTPTTAHGPVHHSASSTALPRKMQPPSPIPAPVREAP